MSLLSREEFQSKAFDRTNGECIVPWCDTNAVDAHHIIERELWPDGGYYLENAANVCSKHHRAAEENTIPPQAFWRWHVVEPRTPNGLSYHVDKWGEAFEHPPTDPSLEPLGHLPFSSGWTDSEADFRSLDSFTDLPLVAVSLANGSDRPVATYDDEYDVWTAWHEMSGKPRDSVSIEYEAVHRLYDEFPSILEELDTGNGVVVRSAYPFHHSQVSERVAVFTE